MLEGHRSVPFERRQPGIGGRGDYGAQNPNRQIAVMVLFEVVDGGGLWEASQAADYHDLVGGSVIEDDGGYSSKVGRLRKGNVDSDAGGNPGVYRVASLLEDTESRRRRQRVPAGHHVVCSPDRRPKRRKAYSQLRAPKDITLGFN